MDNANNSEKAVMGCLMLYPEKFGVIKQMLNADDFDNRHHQSIFKGFEHYYQQGLQADLTLLKDYFLTTDTEMDWFYLSSLSEAFVLQSSIISYCKTVKEASMKRSLFKLLLQCQEKITKNNTRKTKDLVSELMSAALQIDTFRESKFDMASAIEHFQEHLQKDTTLVSLGFPELDEASQGGVYKHGLVTIGADSGAGKTVFACNMACNKAAIGEKVLFINLEIPVVDMLENLAAINGDSSYSYADIIQGNQGVENYVSESLAGLNIYFARDCYSIEDIIAQIDTHRLNYGIESVFIDHGQLIQNSEDYQKYVGITKNLKRYTLTHEIPVFLLSQLNDNKEKRADKEPRKSDLRGGANLYQDSDIVLFLYRLDPEDEQVYLKFAKNRKGASGKALYYEINYSPQTRQVGLTSLITKPKKEEESVQKTRYGKGVKNF